jgi:peroxiredoxin Q/BCP
MVSPGDKLDLDFGVTVVRDSQAKEMRFGDLLQRHTVVSVYMKNKTPSCDRQNDNLVAHARDLAELGYDLVAISRDTAGSHQRYAALKDIPYTLVSDPDDRFARATDSLIEKSMYGRSFVGPARAAYVLEADGTVLAVIPKVDPANHAGQLRAALQSL